MLVDTHAHLTMHQFDPDREEVLRRGREAGLRYMITVGSEEEEWSGAMDLARRHGEEGLFAAIGVHPHEASSLSETALDRLRECSADPVVKAVGEIGLDYHYMHAPAAVQEEAFRRQIRVAREVGLPVIVHSREAEQETMKILKEEAADRVGGVIHCFSGGLEMAREALRMGFFVSFSGSLTFRNADGLREVAKALPVEKLLIETDSPYLAPQPVRGKRNEPAFVRFVAETLAEIKGLSVEDIGRIAVHNMMHLFGIGERDEAGKIAYRIRDSLYLNITNRCTNACGFCIRTRNDFVKGHKLRLTREPSAEEVMRAVGDPRQYKEVVFCGYGEPLLRLDLVKEVAAWLKEQGARVRVNTNGQGNLIHERDILPELRGLVDAYSVSLNAQDQARYLALCRPLFGAGTFEAVKAFVREAGRYAEVSVTVVDLPDVDAAACREIAEKELQAGFRMRYYDEVG